MNKIEHLKTIYTGQLGDENVVIGKIIEPNGKYDYIPFLEGTNIVRALYEIYINKRFQSAKILLYKAARVAEYMSNKFDSRIIDSGIYQISYALLSDNSELIERYSILKNTINDDTNIGYQLPNAVQNILLEDWDKLAWNIRCLERFVKHPKFVLEAPVIDVFNGFRYTDTDLIKQGLLALIKTHNKRNKDSLIYKFLSVDTAGYTKLAWIKGYEIDLKTSLVPVELMPIKPLDDYPEYDFLKE